MRFDAKIMQNTKTIGILLFPAFSNLGLANAVEPLRAANDLSRKRLYRWRYLGLDTAPMRSSSGLPVTPEARLADASGDLLIVCPSYGHMKLATPACLRALRAAARRFAVLAGVDTGAPLLAAAGLLDGYRATCHWDELDRFSETYPDVAVTRDRFVIDRNRVSSGGATTTLELMLRLIETDQGAMLAHEVAALFMHGEGADPLPHGARRRVRAAAAVMRRHIEEPLTIDALARQMGLTRRGLEQAFRESGDLSPARLYRRIRLNEARRLVLDSSQTVAEIATRCGYGDPAAMTRAFRSEFGATPRMLRRGSMETHGADGPAGA